MSTSPKVDKTTSKFAVYGYLRSCSNNIVIQDIYNLIYSFIGLYHFLLIDYDWSILDEIRSGSSIMNAIKMLKSSKALYHDENDILGLSMEIAMLLHEYKPKIIHQEWDYI